ncbi:MAG: ATP synthase F1 subunit epsilon [Bacillota bacterium]
MGARFSFRIITPEKDVTEETDFVRLRATDGDLGILKGHAPLVGALAVGEMDTGQADRRTKFAVAGGLILVNPESAILLSTAAERRDEIDIERAIRAKERAASRLHQDDADHIRAENALKRALTRLEVGRGDR